jgi:hypothetical protein
MQSIWHFKEKINKQFNKLDKNALLNYNSILKVKLMLSIEGDIFNNHLLSIYQNY